MSITENFLVNTKNFESIIEQLCSVKELPGQVNNVFLEKLGYSNPSDLLVLHLFKDLQMLDQDGAPTPLFKKFRNDSTSDEALAEGIINAYNDLFKGNPSVYKLPQEELKEEFKKFFGSTKSDLILKYMANTFLTLVNYAGIKTVEKVAGQIFPDSQEGGQSIKKVAGHQNNGTQRPPSVNAESDEEIAVADANENIKKEEKGKAAIEDFFPDKVEKDTEKQAAEPQAESQMVSEEDLKKIIEEKKKEIEEQRNEKKEETEEPATSQTETVEKPEEPVDTSASESDDDNEMSDPFSFEEEEDANEPEPEEPVVASDSETDSDNEVSDPFGFEEEENASEPEPEEPTMEEVTEPKPKKGDKEFVDKAFIKKAELLYKMEKYEEALPAFKAIVDRYRDSEESDYQEYVSKAIIRRASILGEMDRYDEALPAYDDVIDRFENSEKTELYNYASEALIKKVEIMEMLELTDQLYPLYAKLVQRLGSSTDPRFVSHVDKAYVKVAKMKLDSGEPDKALKAINGVIDRFEKSNRKNEFLEQAMYQKAELLEQLGRDEEALRAYENFLSRFGSDS